jgi:hypothetical protein
MVDDLVAPGVSGAVLKRYESVGHAFVAERRDVVFGDALVLLQLHS